MHASLPISVMSPDLIALRTAGYFQPPEHRRPGHKRVEYAGDLGILLNADQSRSCVEADQVAHPGENGHVPDCVQIAHQPLTARQPLVENREQALRLTNITVTGPLVLVVLACELVEEADLAKHRTDTAHLEHEPLQRLVPARGGRQHEA